MAQRERGLHDMEGERDECERRWRRVAFEPLEDDFRTKIGEVDGALLLNPLKCLCLVVASGEAQVFAPGS